MIKYKHLMCEASVGGLAAAMLLMHTAPALAQSEPAQAADSQSAIGVGDIIVTARRQAENLQNVPQTVVAVSGDTTQKLAITQIEDIPALVPGLALTGGTASPTPGTFAAIQIRGVPYDLLAAASPSVDTYLNEVPFDGRAIFSGLYDIGSIQVLQGPQGTARGRAAPSGAMLITTRAPTMNQFGGYASGLVATKGERNLQAALNIPLVEDVLAVRVAGLYNRTEGNFVHSVNSDVDPFRRDWSGRISALFTPTDTLRFQVNYQHLDQNSTQFPQVEGTGAPGGVSPLAPAGYNGPPIRAQDRLSVSDFPFILNTKYDSVTGQADWTVFGQKLTYIGGYYKSKLDSDRAADDGNQIIGRPVDFFTTEHQKVITHEIRLASDGGNLIDYTVGYFRSRLKGDSFSTVPGQTPLLGAFGTPGLPGSPPADPRGYNVAYSLPVSYLSTQRWNEDSVFASLTLHANGTEITGGVRYMNTRISNPTLFTLGSGRSVAFALPPGGTCPQGFLASAYAGYCDVLVNPGFSGVFPANGKFKPWIWNGSISHRFNDQVLAYASAGTSFRLPNAVVGLNNANNDPVLRNIVEGLKPERSKSFEIGFKTNWLDNRLRFNVAAFYQMMDGLLVQVKDIPYRNVSVPGTAGQVSGFSISTNADAIVTGFNMDAAFQATPNWSISGSLAYAKAKADNARVPCRDTDFNGIPDNGANPTVAQFIAAGRYIALCNTNQILTLTPLWNGNLTSEYYHSFGSVDGYVRGLLNYYSKNPRATPGFTSKAYALLNLYAGVRSPDGAWDIGAFVRNVTNTGVQLGRGLDDLGTDAFDAQFGRSGYVSAAYTPPRQFGLNVRYSFGSR